MFAGKTWSFDFLNSDTESQSCPIFRRVTIHSVTFTNCHVNCGPGPPTRSPRERSPREEAAPDFDQVMVLSDRRHMERLTAHRATNVATRSVRGSNISGDSDRSQLCTSSRKPTGGRGRQCWRSHPSDGAMRTFNSEMARLPS